MKPRIAITTGPEEEGGVYTRLRTDYLRAIDKAGGIPFVVSSIQPNDVPSILEGCDGILLSGGPDVDPEHFGEEAHENLGSVVRERDTYELALAREAVRRDVPLLAICRGLQVLNVALGGGLVQDIPSSLNTPLNHAHQGPRTDLVHEVEIEATSRLGALLGSKATEVNSFHHQSIGRVAPGLAVSARSPRDGVIEAAEAPDRRYAIGVQWHPENFWREHRFDRLFSSFTDAARAAWRSG